MVFKNTDCDAMEESIFSFFFAFIQVVKPTCTMCW